MAQLTGKTALITGASVGIGRDLAELFAANGHHLVITARNRQQLADLATRLRQQHGVNVEVIDKDLSLPGTAQELFDQIQVRGIAVDFLVNNAGFGTFGKFADSEVAAQLGMLQVNVAALTHLCRLFLPPMLARRGGRILNVASTAAFQPGPLMAVYYASKAYVVSFSEALDAENHRKGVTVTALCPGPTITEFQKRAGITNSRLFRLNSMSSADVARIGYDGMMSGRRVVIAGFRNRVMALGAKLAPRRFTTAVAKKLNSNR
jgi:short-subunit dehydrogenase